MKSVGEYTVQAEHDNISNLDFCSLASYAKFAHFECYCGALQTSQKTDLLTVELIAP